MSQTVCSGRVIPPPPEERPPARFNVKLTRSFARQRKGWLPVRRYYGSDGDWTNQHVWFGLEWVERGYDDPLVSLGVEMVIPPRLFWVLGLLRLR